MRNSKSPLTFPDNNSLPDGVRTLRWQDLLWFPVHMLNGLVKVLWLLGRRGHLLRFLSQMLIVFASIPALHFLIRGLLDDWWALTQTIAGVYAAWMFACITVVTIQRWCLRTRYYFTDAGDAFLSVQRNADYWEASGHVSATPGQGRKLRLALVPELMKTGADLHIKASHPEIADLYQKEASALVVVTTHHRSGRVDMILRA